MKFYSKLHLIDLAKRATRWGDASLTSWYQSISKHFTWLQGRRLYRKPHPILGVMVAGLLLWISLDFWVLPYMRQLEGSISLRPAQWSQMENLVKLSKTAPAQQITIEPIDEAELQKIRMTLIAKKIKPSVLRLSLENPPRIEFQASDVLFSSVVDVLEELRATWHLYPERVEVSATSKMVIVNVSAALIQTSNPNTGSNFSSLDKGASR